MAALKFTDKQVKLIMQTDVLSDVVNSSDSFNSRFDKILAKLRESKDPRDFFLVVLDESDHVSGIVTSKELGSFMNKHHVKYDVEFGKLAVPAITMAVDEPISKALDLFESSNANVLLITDNQGKYVGKLKRTNLDDRVSELIKIYRT